jgi:hypothetical protein
VTTGVQEWRPPATGSETPTAPLYRTPSWAFRSVIGGIRLIFLLILLVALPVGAINFLHSFKIPFPISVQTEILYGVTISVLLTARYMLRPTRAYGPICVATALVTIAFFLLLLSLSPYVLSIPNTSASISLGFALLLLLLLIVPALSLIAGVVTTVEDVRRPTERLAIEFPP